MTHVYDEYGRRITVTAIQAGPCTVLTLREPARHGYQAVQLGFEPVPEKALTKPRLGQCQKQGTSPFRYVREFRTAADGESALTFGQQVTVELFQENELVDVTGWSIGKGFQGGVKRWGWSGGPQTHGSMSHRAPGSIGSTTTPGRVLRGHHLPGHMGHARVTIQNLRVVRRDVEHHLLLVAGAVPGPERQLVMISKSIKHPGLIKKPQAFQVVVEEEEKQPAKKSPAKKI